MNVQQIKEFQTAIDATNWKMDFDEFCKRTGFVGEYAKDKWRKWQAIGQAFNHFDAETLAKITGG